MMRLRNRIVLGILALIFVVFVGVWVYYFHLGGLESLVMERINSALGSGSPLAVKVGEIRGDIISGVVVEDVSIRYCDSLNEFDILHTDRIVADYSIRNLWNKKYIFNHLRFENLVLTVTRTSEGQYILPLLSTGSGGDSELLLLSIESLQLGNATIRFNNLQDTILLNNLDLSASLRVEENTYSAEIRSLRFASQPSGYGLSGAFGKVTYAGGNLVFDDWLINHNDTRIKISGNVAIAEKSGLLDFAVDNLDLKEVTALVGPHLKGLLDLNGRLAFNPDGLGGQVSLGGNFLLASFENLFVDFRFSERKLVFDTLYGTILGSCAIAGAGDIDFSVSPEVYHLKADIRNFDLNQLIDNTFYSDLSGRIELTGCSFRNADMLLEIETRLFESSFDEYPIQQAAGMMEITTDSICFREGIWVDYFENHFDVTGKINYNDDIHLQIRAQLDNLDRYEGKLFVDQPGGRGQAEAVLSGRTSDPDLDGWFVSDSLWLYGLFADSCYATYDIKRFLTGRQGWVEVILYDGSAWRVPYDTGYGIITLDSTIALIDTVFFHDDYATACTRGRLDYGIYPQQLVLDTLALEVLDHQFFNIGKPAVNIDSVGFDFNRSRIGWESADIFLDGRINFDETMVFALRLTDVAVAPWLHLLKPDWPVEGYLSCAANVGGSFGSPAIDLTGSLDSLVYRELVLGDLSVGTHYRDQVLTIDSLLILSDPGRYRAAGHLSIDLAFVADDIDRLPDRPFDLKIDATDRRFDLVTLFLPSVEDLKGDFYADVQLSGTPSEPHLDGEAFIRNGRLKYFDLVDTLKTDSAIVTMKDNRITINDMEVYVYNKKRKRKSYVTINGDLTVKSLDTLHYDLDVTLMREFPFRYELDDIEGVIEGEMHIFGNTPPTVTGELTMTSCRYLAEFSSEEEGSPLMIALSGENTWDLNLNIDILSNYWIKNQDIDAEFSGFMNLIRENGRYRFIGDMEILKGKGYLFDKTFRIQSPSRVVFEDIEYPNPRLDITATTRIPVAQFEEEEERSQVELAIHVTGTLDNPEFNVAEGAEGDTAFSNEDILPLIVANYYGSESNSIGAFEERVSQLISSQVSQIGTRQLGVETFEIDPTYEGQLDLMRTRVTLGVYTTSNLYVYGRSAVSFDRGQEVGFQYRFNKAVQFEGRRDEQEFYHLNFKLHWEF